jgi:hypothetical protein
MGFGFGVWNALRIAVSKNARKEALWRRMA